MLAAEILNQSRFPSSEKIPCATVRRKTEKRMSNKRHLELLTRTFFHMDSLKTSITMGRYPVIMIRTVMIITTSLSMLDVFNESEVDLYAPANTRAGMITDKYIHKLFLIVRLVLSITDRSFAFRVPTCVPENLCGFHRYCVVLKIDYVQNRTNTGHLRPLSKVFPISRIFFQK
jgi:hypothetical protein